jgi:hypothetical protein
MPGLKLYNHGFYQNIAGNSKVVSGTVFLGSTKGRGSSTRIFNNCTNNSTNPSLCINQFINISNQNNNQNSDQNSDQNNNQPNVCNLLPKNTPYQLCSPWPQFGGLDNTNSRYTPILGSQTGILKLLNVSDNLFQASTSPAIASDGTIYIGFNYLGSTNQTRATQGYLFAFNSDGSIKWRYSLINTNSLQNPTQLYFVFDSSTPAIGKDGTIYFGTTTNNIGNQGQGPVLSTTVYAINPNGTLKWSTDVLPSGSPNTPQNANNSVSISASLIIGSDNNLYFGCYSNNSIIAPFTYSSLFSLNSNNGTTNWEFSLSTPSFLKLFTNPLTIPPRIEDSVTIDNNNNIYFICNQPLPSVVYLISLTSDGTYRYYSDLNNFIYTLGIQLYGTPVLSIDNSVVYAMSYFFQSGNGSYYLYSINTVTGTQTLIDTFPFTKSRYLRNNSMARDNNNNLYFSTINEKPQTVDTIVVLYSYSVNNNLANWTYEITTTYSANIDCTPAIGSDGTVYFGVFSYSGFPSLWVSSDVYALNTNGTLKWKINIPLNSLYSTISTSPCINSQGNIILSVLTKDNNNYYRSNLYSFN